MVSGEIRPDSDSKAIEDATNEAEEQIIKDVLADMQDPTGELNSMQVPKVQGPLSGVASESARNKRLIFNPTINQQIRNRVNFNKRPDM
jgi:hypothetical protein